MKEKVIFFFWSQKRQQNIDETKNIDGVTCDKKASHVLKKNYISFLYMKKYIDHV